MPKENAEGHLTWNPSVGLYHSPAKVKRESYGGIIGALQDQAVALGSTTKSYPENFAGIIAAIQDLAVAKAPDTPVEIGPQPPGGEIIIRPDGTPEWIVTVPPRDGTLWFDTRQGRLFTWIEDDWYQTNGGDGIPIVTPDFNPPAIDVGVPGQLWYDQDNGTLYIFTGEYIDTNGDVQDHPPGTMVWKLVADIDNDFLQTTATLPLTQMGVAHPDDDYFDVVPELPAGNAMQVQKDYNEWLFDAVTALDQGLGEIEPVYVSDTPPDPPVAGQLWYDTEALELSIAYQDDDSLQWVPVSAAYNYDDDLTAIRSLVTTETRHREHAIHLLQERVDRINTVDSQEIQQLELKVNAQQEQIDAVPTYDLEPYLLTATHTADISAINSRLSSVEAKTDTLNNYATTAALAALQSAVNAKPSSADLQAVQDSIPDVSAFTVEADITSAIENITTEYLPRTGGTLTGSFVVEKENYAAPGFDFSGASWHSKEAFKLRANTPAEEHTATFGSTENFWEYAWNFSSDEDFCWVYNDTNKVFSITKEGPACSTLILGNIGDNTVNGRVIHNKIDVKERLNTYQTAFEQVRQGVSSATDFDSLKANILSALASV